MASRTSRPRRRRQRCVSDPSTSSCSVKNRLWAIVRAGGWGRRSGPTLPGLVCDAGIGVFSPGTVLQACKTPLRQASSGPGELAHQLSDIGGQVTSA